MKKIAVFASGKGSNAKNLYSFFKNSKEVSVALIASNSKKSLVVDWGKKTGLPVFIFTKTELNTFSEIRNVLLDYKIDFVVLAGFLLKIPADLVAMYKNKIINIHPSLLPLYGGRGMYGHFVHDAVLKNKETKTGITIHLVDEEYDRGKILFQKSCSVDPKESVVVLAKRVLEMEHKYFPVTIKKYISSCQL